MLVLAILCTVFGFAYRRVGGPSWAFYVPLLLVAMAAVQITMGFTRVRGGHVFFGVLFLCTVTAFCSYCWRLKPIGQRGSA